MDRLYSLLKVFLLDKFRISGLRTSNNKKYIMIAVLLVVCFAPIIIGIIGLMYYLGGIAIENGIADKVVSTVITATQFVSLVLGLVYFINTVYMGKDNEITSYLPVKSSTVFAAKLIVVYLSEFAACVLLFLLTLIPFGMGAGMGFAYHTMIIPVMVIAPIFPLSVAAIIAVPFMYLISLFKNKGVLSTVLLCVLFAAVFIGYYFFIFSIQGNNPSDSIAEIAVIFERYVSKIGSALPFNLWIARAVCATDILSGLGYFGLSIGCNALMLAVTCLLSSLVYGKSQRSRLEFSNSKGSDKGHVRGGSVVKMLIEKDAKTILRFPSLGLACFMQIVVSVVLPIILVMGNNGSQASVFATIESYIGTLIIPAVGVVGAFSASSNVVAYSAISREGEEYTFMKLIPVDIKTQLKAKAILAHSFNLVSIALFYIVLAFVGLRLSYALPAFVISILFGIPLTYFQIHFDFGKPRLHWNVISQATKNNPSSLAGLLAYAVTLLAMGIVIVACMFLNNATPYVGSVIACSVAVALPVALTLVLRAKLMRDSQKLLLNLGNIG
ncbi:MAG: hypothetical protein PHX51_01650 [Clostridia bacterium]|nr:hypothetical protein [Clostridia bacterium]